MRKLALLFVGLAGCATVAPRHAEVFVMGGYAFQGERFICLINDSSEQDLDFEVRLRAAGFRVCRQIPQVKSVLPSRYVLTVHGRCPAVFAQTRADLNIEVFDSQGNERVFAAHLDNTDECPESFYNEVIRALRRHWESPPSQPPSPATDRL